nr:hypothetical protein [Actinomycetales bacterium]
MARTISRRRSTRTAGALLAFGLALAGCSGGEGGDPTTAGGGETGEASGSSSGMTGGTTAGPTTTAPPTSLPTDLPQGIHPDLAYQLDYLDGIEEQWTVPGSVVGLSPDGRAMLVRDAPNSFAYSLYPIGPEAGEAVWTGLCAPNPSGITNPLTFLGERILCGSEVVDPQTGESEDFPVDGFVMVGAADGVLVVAPHGESRLVAYDESLSEVWSAEGLEFTLSGFTPGAVVVAQPEDDPGAPGRVLLTATGEQIAEGYAAIPMEDGVLVARDAAGTEWAGYTYEGEELWSYPFEGNSCAVAQFGAEHVIGDCSPEAHERWDEAFDGTQTFVMWLADTEVAVALGEGGFAVAGTTYDFEPYGVRGFGNLEHFVAFERSEAGEMSTSLLRVGESAPVWVVDSYLLSLRSVGGEILAERGDEVVVYTAPRG